MWIDHSCMFDDIMRESGLFGHTLGYPQLFDSLLVFIKVEVSIF